MYTAKSKIEKVPRDVRVHILENRDEFGLSLLVFYITCNDISVIYVTAHVQADRRKSCTYGRAPNAIYILQGSLTCPFYTDTGPPFLYGDSDTPPHLVAFYDTLGIQRTFSRLKPPASSRWATSSGKGMFPTSPKWDRTRCLEE